MKQPAREDAVVTGRRLAAVGRRRKCTVARGFRDLYRKLPEDARRRIEERVETALKEMPLHELREARNLTQQQLAAQLRSGQAAVSKLERRADMYVSTLRRFIEAMGGELVILARFPDGDVRITGFRGDRSAGS